LNGAKTGWSTEASTTISTCSDPRGRLSRHRPARIGTAWLGQLRQHSWVTFISTS
jgi:hypothetical protein